ncbi:GtrA family protein [Haloterrigena turkmenica DSM 5511]|uniref:GtrA family protein n=1 Tax=Haloterrigena turkmenica (strain ATCC 51198 / DSM 5511 / JCM 9101 / NCIMB 13204 / VKM B-1734 / 4k) TaxID=543526 RepID=D2RXT6_HALTV|nr:GtrA family protein [Haloterrigena turkmenica]ADB59770.1 GtrA family protein [Haloterrigena turkmenica DSM 5511]
MSDSFAEAVRTRFRALLSTARFSQFAGVGIVGATVDIVGLALLVDVFDLWYLGAKTISWELSIVVIFAINEHWTFATYGDMTPRALARRFLRSNAVRFAGFLVTLTVYGVLVDRFGVWYLTANVVGIAVGFFVNYTCESLYTWKVHHD